MASGLSLYDQQQRSSSSLSSSSSKLNSTDLEAELRRFLTNTPQSLRFNNPSQLLDLWFNSFYSSMKLPLCVDDVRNAVEVLIDKILCEETMRRPSCSSENDLQSKGVKRKLASHCDLLSVLRTAATGPRSSRTTERLEGFMDQIAQVREALRVKIPNLNSCPFYQVKEKSRRKFSSRNGVKQNRGTRRSQRCLEKLNIFESTMPNKRIPVGPEFQAEVSIWKGTTNLRSILDTDDKFLGTRVWPLEVNHMEPNPNDFEIVVGKGRPDLCSCSAPGSVSCSRSHVNEARMELRLKLGPAYTDLQFGEMGEVISSSWTPEEESTFESLLRRNRLSKRKSFFDAAVTAFPSKNMRDIVSYYFNVFIQRQISIKSRAQLTVHSDDDCDNANDDKGQKASHYLRRFDDQQKRRKYSSFGRDSSSSSTYILLDF